jgi:hypothetical protein
MMAKRTQLAIAAVGLTGWLLYVLRSFEAGVDRDPVPIAVSVSAVDPPEPKSDGVLESLDADVLRERTIDSFPAGYLTFIAIIQGVALAVVIAEAVKRMGEAEGPAGALLVASQSLFCFTAIIVVSYEYLWFTTIMRWTPTFRDAAIPYCLGVGETVPALIEGPHYAWWWAQSAFLLISVAAFLHTYSKLREGMFEGKDGLLPMLRRLFLILILSTSSGLFLTLGLAVLCSTVRLSIWFSIFAPLGLIGAGAVIAGESERYLNRLYAEYGVSRGRRQPA